MADVARSDELAQLRAEVAALRRRVERPARRRPRLLIPLALLAVLVALVPLALLAANPFTDLNPGSRPQRQHRRHLQRRHHHRLRAQPAVLPERLRHPRGDGLLPGAHRRDRREPARRPRRQPGRAQPRPHQRGLRRQRPDPHRQHGRVRRRHPRRGRGLPDRAHPAHHPARDRPGPDQRQRAGHRRDRHRDDAPAPGEHQQQHLARADAAPRHRGRAGRPGSPEPDLRLRRSSTPTSPTSSSRCSPPAPASWPTVRR